MPSQGLQQVQRLGLQQTLSPQMQQSLHILQVPAMELNALIRQELTTNPVLEETQSEESSDESASTDPEEMERSETNGEDAEMDKEFEQLAKLDEEWREYFNQTNTPVRPTAEQDQQWRAFFESVAHPQTLQEHLLAQLHLADVDKNLRPVCEILVGNIDDRGYLAATAEEMTAWSGDQPGSAEAALRIIQSFDPIGVGARDLRECLLLQLRRLGHGENSLACRMITAHLDDLAARRHAEIAASLGASLEDVHRAAALISTLNPQPGNPFSADDNRYITPDMSVQKVGDDWVVVSNDDWLPSIRISNTYKDILGQSSQNREVKSYVRERIRAAKVFIKSIQQRQQTVMKIAREIVSVQMDFFNQGREFLKPLTMTEVAEKIGVHETTISRAIANKYMQTPHGIFELKYFFTPGIRLADGGSMTPDSVKAAIADLVASEAPEKPLADQEIMRALKTRGIPLARRTVAKYREELKILPSHQRRVKSPS
ncbi:MAG: RNA polymerase factor sigma-54 [Verrucomicrobia bacterium]|nr:RNA polymerase factor sigma-54 [Verrucomicrobiota bacterium]